MLQYLTDQKIPELAMVKERIATLEKRAHIKAKEHLDFGALHTPLQTNTYYWGKYYGEVNADGKEYGRSIIIYDNGYIMIGYFENGWSSTGNYIHIYSDGGFQVGDMYLTDGEIWNRGTSYKTDGTEKKYDKKC